MTETHRELVEIQGDQILIRIPISSLPIAAPIAWERYSPRKIVVTDLWPFAFEVLRQLKREQENGDTLVTGMLDTAVMRAIEIGCLGSCQTSFGGSALVG